MQAAALSRMARLTPKDFAFLFSFPGGKHDLRMGLGGSFAKTLALVSEPNRLIKWHLLGVLPLWSSKLPEMKPYCL